MSRLSQNRNSKQKYGDANLAGVNKKQQVVIETLLGWKQETLIAGISDQHNGQLSNTLSGIRDMSTLLQQVLI